MIKRQFLSFIFICFLPAAMAAETLSIEVWKSPTCGCCKKWIEHLEDSGFSVSACDEGNNRARARLGMPRAHGSCHTALIDGYVIEGHVPANDIMRLLKEKPKAIGLSVPGMPIGSPGMDGPEYKGHKDPFDVLLVESEEKSSTFSRY